MSQSSSEEKKRQPSSQNSKPMKGRLILDLSAPIEENVDRVYRALKARLDAKGFKKEDLLKPDK
jgi:hypothetical protein